MKRDFDSFFLKEPVKISIKVWRSQLNKVG